MNYNDFTSKYMNKINPATNAYWTVDQMAQDSGLDPNLAQGFVYQNQMNHNASIPGFAAKTGYDPTAWNPGGTNSLEGWYSALLGKGLNPMTGMANTPASTSASTVGGGRMPTGSRGGISSPVNPSGPFVNNVGGGWNSSTPMQNILNRMGVTMPASQPYDPKSTLVERNPQTGRGGNGTMGIMPINDNRQIPDFSTLLGGGGSPGFAANSGGYQQQQIDTSTPIGKILSTILNTPSMRNREANGNLSAIGQTTGESTGGGVNRPGAVVRGGDSTGRTTGGISSGRAGAGAGSRTQNNAAYYSPMNYNGNRLGDVNLSLLDEHGGINYGMLPGLLSALWGISYPQAYQSAAQSNDLYNWMTQIFGGYPTNLAGNQGSIINQLLGLSNSGMPANAASILGGGGNYGATDALSQILKGGLPNQTDMGNIASYFSNMATNGGLTPEYVSSMNQTVYQPMMEQLMGNINSMAGGSASLNSPLSQELQRKATTDYMANLTQQAFNNMNQQAQTATNAFGSVAGNVAPYISMAGNLGMGLSNQNFNQQLAALNAALGGTNTMQGQLIGGLEQLLGGQQQYGLGQQSQSNDMVRQLIAMYALQHPQQNAPGAASAIGSILSRLFGSGSGSGGSGGGGSFDPVQIGKSIWKSIFGGGSDSSAPANPDMYDPTSGIPWDLSSSNFDWASLFPSMTDSYWRMPDWSEYPEATFDPYNSGSIWDSLLGGYGGQDWLSYWNGGMGQNPYQYAYWPYWEDPAVTGWLDSLGMYNYA